MVLIRHWACYKSSRCARVVTLAWAAQEADEISFSPFVATRRIQREREKQTNLGTSPECTKRVCRQRTGGQLSETQSAAPSAASQETQLRQACGVVWVVTRAATSKKPGFGIYTSTIARVYNRIHRWGDQASQTLLLFWFRFGIPTPPARYGTARLKHAVATSSLPCSSILAEYKNNRLIRGTSERHL